MFAFLGGLMAGGSLGTQLGEANGNCRVIAHHKPSQGERELEMKLEWVRRSYFSPDNSHLSRKSRRALAYAKLVKLPQMTPQLAKVVLEQWDASRATA